ncbi:MAG: hypothetical protein JO033_08015 [Acidobacteriaceae bacterium]|nr:hypothetical protein [Acidobacteriota bacterium]MBV8808604.1 hypothetical protein [Acidobacteriaceae bacterium]MBV9499795.1 hypothetical protein [Acidobacteriaceae bacterium]
MGSQREELEKLAAKSLKGDEAAKRFDAVVSKVLSVPREELLRRQAEYKRTTHLRGKKRGPKPKQPVSPVVDEGMDRTSEQPEA